MSSRPNLPELSLRVSDLTEIDWDGLETELEAELIEDLRALERLIRFNQQARTRDDLPIPDRWGKYLLQSQLGSGGFGVVYKAFNPDLRQHVAIKLIRPDTADSKERRRQILAEAQMMARIRHPNVVSVYDVDEHDGRVGIVMELVEGKTLERIVNADGPLRAEEVAMTGIDVCRAMVAVNGQGLNHCDITARNVMRRLGGQTVLMDFGLGSRAGKLESESGALRGTPLYSAPELFEGALPSKASDIYALGVLLFFLACGEFPIVAEDIDHLTELHRNNERRILRDLRTNLPAKLLQVIDTATAPDRSKRYRSFGCMESDLQAVFDSGPTRFLGQVSLTMRWALAVLLCGVVLGVVMAFSGWLRNAGQDSPGEIREQNALVTWPYRERGGQFSPDGEWISFLSDRGGSVGLWVQRLNGEARRIDIEGDSVLGHCWSPDGSAFAVLVERDGQTFLDIVPVAGRAGTPSMTALLQRGRWSIVRWLGSGLYLLAGGTLWEFDLATGELESKWKAANVASSRVRSMDIRPDGGALVVASDGPQGEQLYASSLQDPTLKPLSDDAYRAYNPKWIRTSSGWGVVFSSNLSGNLDLWLFPRLEQHGSPTQLTFGANEELLEDATLDGGRFLYRVESERASIWTVDSGTGVERPVTYDTLADLNPSFSNASQLLVFQRTGKTLGKIGHRYGDTDVFISGLRGDTVEGPHRLHAGGQAPTISPDGRWVTFTETQPDGSVSLVLTDINGRMVQRIHENIWVSYLRLFPFGWSQNVKWFDHEPKFCFVGVSVVGGTEIMVAQPDSAGRWTTRSVYATSPEVRLSAPAPHGLKLAFLAHQESPPQWSIFVREEPGSESRRVYDLETAEQVALLGWSGERLVALESSFNPEQTSERLRFFELLHGTIREIKRVDRALSQTATLGATAGAIFVTAVDEDGHHNVARIGIADGQADFITSNRLPEVTFSGLTPGPSGKLLYSKQERNANLWLMRIKAKKTIGAEKN